MIMSVNMEHDDMGYRSTSEQFQDARSSHTSYRSIPRETSVSQSSTWDPSSSKMSPARRTFCLFTTFDLILTFILWIIYTQLIGITPIWKAFEEQVYEYEFKNSMFDTVMIATARFTFIILAYALFRISHWWVIAVSTSMTCIYLLFKCFLFDFNDKLLGGKNPLSYVLLIVGFVLAWIETWMLDFKVIPSEHRLKRRGLGNDPERAPLLRGARIEDTGEYYSPFHTPEGSEDELEPNHHTDHHPPHHHPHLQHHHDKPYDRHSDSGSLTSSISRKELEHYTQLLSDAKAAFLEMLHMDGWKLETGKSLKEGLIYSQNIKKFGRKIFKLQGIISNISPHDLWRDMVATLNDSPKWNPTILESRTLQHVDECIEVNYSIAAEAAGGLVSARDFVSARQWSAENNMYINVGIGTTHPDMPPQKKYVRGDNGPGGWAFQPVPDDPTSCLFTWIVNTNLKGWLPQAAIDQAMSGVLSSYFKLLVEHYREVLQQQTNGV